MLRIVRVLVAVGLAGGVWLMSPASAEYHALTDVAVEDDRFEPQVFEVDVGGKVRWTQAGNNPHSVTRHDDGQGEEFDSHPDCSFQTFPLCMQNGDTFEWTFQSPGRFTYYCKIHGSASQPCNGMCGEIVVRGVPAPAPEPQPEPEPRPDPAPPAPVAPTEPTPTPEPTPEEPEVADEPTPEPTPTPEALADRPEETGGRNAGIIAAAVLAALLAVGGGLFAWRRLS